jgi:glycosidase
MKGVSNPDGWVRLDFAGGWKGDQKNAFTGANLTDSEKEVQALVKKLGNYRKQSSALKQGKLMQYVPKDGVYVYFRYDEKQTVMCVMNTNDKEQDVQFNNFAERTDGFTKAINVVDGNVVSSKFTVPAKKMWVLELKN